MASPTNLQFLDLKDATADEIQRIEKILYGTKSKPLVEFPWQLNVTQNQLETPDASLANCENTTDEFCNEELIEPTNDVMYSPVEESEVAMVPQMVCMAPTCTVATLSHLPGNRMLMSSVPVIQTSLPPPTQMYVPQSQMHPHIRHPLSTGDNLADGKGSPNSRRNKKKRSPHFFVTDKSRTETANTHALPLDDQPFPMTLSPGVTVPIMVPQPIAYPLDHMSAHLAGTPNMTPYSYYASSPIVYPNNGHMYNFMMTSGIYHQSYPPNYMAQASGMPMPNAVNVECGIDESTHCEDVEVIDDFREDEANVIPQEEVVVEEEEYSSVQPLQFQVPVESEIVITPQLPAPVESEQFLKTKNTIVSGRLVKNNLSVELENQTTTQETERKELPPTKATTTETATIDTIKPSAVVVTHTVAPTFTSTSTLASTTATLATTTSTTSVTVSNTVTTVTNSNGVATQKTWASLFASKMPVVTEPVANDVSSSTDGDRPDDDEGFVDQVTERVDAGRNSPIALAKAPIPENLAEVLSNIKLDHHSVHFVPRGLTNPGNWCYINATLQALLSCPPFFNLMRKLPVVAGLKKSASSPIPVIESMVEFFHEFVELSRIRKTSKTDGGKGAKKEEIILGAPFEPQYVYRMLRNAKCEAFKGKQEDAEEFLSCILNRLHEEMLEVMNSGSNKMNNGGVASNDEVSNHICDNENDWLVMGHKNKSCVTRTVHCNPSPIFDIFGGMMRSVLQQAGALKSATLQPFFTLQLDIQAETVTCIKSALEGLVVKETLQGFTSGNSKQEVEASRKITLEKLPPILILHLKRFIFDRNGSRKVMKRIDFGFDLELSKDLLSSVAKANHKQRKFRLCAVVYHDGQDSAKGHYVTDVYHGGFHTWLRTDDAKIWRIPDNHVLKYTPPRVPYLLYYRNIETIE